MSILFVIVLCLTTYSVDTTDNQTNAQNLCHQKGLNILSIFNLKFDTFIQSIDGNGNVDFWRIFGAEYAPNGDPNSDDSHDDIIPEEVTQNHYSDHNMTEVFRSQEFDIKKPIFGYIIPINKQLLSRCPQQENQTVENPFSTPGCQTLGEVVDSGQYFVCFHGLHEKDWDRRWVMIYQSDEGILSEVDAMDLREELYANHCLNVWGLGWKPSEVLQGTYNELHLKFFINWEDYYGNWNNISIVEYKKVDNLISGNVLVRSRLTFNGKPEELVESITKTQRYLVFRFNDYYKFMFCGQNCTLDSRLLWVQYIYNDGILSYVYKMGIHPHEPYLTIRKLLACKPKITRFEPNQFCDSRQHFISIFNLGNDIYFQRSGRFWRYLSTGFTTEAIPDSNLNISPIRLDSGMGEILQRDNFDTTQRVFGFTFKAPVLPDYDMCNTLNYDYEPDVTKCKRFYTESDNYFRSCLYGKQPTFPIKRVTINYDLVYAYQYIPAGLRNFDKSNVKIFDETLAFCYDLLQMMDDYSGYDMTSIINPGSYREDDNTEINRIYLLMERVDGDGQRHSKTLSLKWKFDDPLNFKSSVTKKELNTEMESQRSVPKFFFSLGLNVYGYGFEMNGNIYQFIDILRELGSFETRVFTTLSQLFNCPFNSSTSLLTTNKRKRICDRPPHKHLKESVFCIGDLHYHQMGQYFYAFNKKDVQFYYDKYTTDLLNDYFDTTERVTGYTVPLNKIIRAHQDVTHTQTFIVIIYGRSGFGYRELGEYIFATFKIDDNIAAKLTAINGNNIYSFARRTTLGNTCPLTQDKRLLAIHSQISLPRFYLDVNYFLIFVIENELNFDFYLTFSTNESFFGLESAFNDEIWEHYSFHKSTLKDEIIGIHPGLPGSAGHILFLVHRTNDTLELVQNRLGNYSVDNIHKGFHTYLKREDYGLPKDLDYNQVFCSKRPQDSTPNPEQNPKESDSNPDSPSTPKTLTFVLAIFVLILLIIALFVGLINYFSNQKVSKQPNQPINTMKPMKAEPTIDTLEPNRPNYTVIRQPDPIVDKPQPNSNGDERESQMSVRSDEI